MSYVAPRPPLVVHGVQARRGMRFDHRSFITGSPAAGTARPQVFVVTAVRCGAMYYRSEGGSKWVAHGQEAAERAVLRWLDQDLPPGRITVEEAMSVIRAVESGDLPSGSVVVKVTGPASLTDPAPPG